MHTAYQAQWLRHSGKVVTLNGRAYVVRAYTYDAVYPYPHTVLRVFADMVDQRSPHYRQVKRELGDDWSVDILASEPEVTCTVMAQVGWQEGGE